MEAAGITSHSAESMRSHFRQVLCAQLPKTSLDSVGQRPPRSRRHEYTEREDRAIIDYIIQNKCYAEASTRKFWYRLERERLTTHSAESMRNRFRRRLLHRTLAELRCLLTFEEYEATVHLLIRPSAQARSLCGQSSLDFTDDFNIIETTTEDGTDVSHTVLNHSSGGTLSGSRTDDWGKLSHTSISHSTPHKKPINSNLGFQVNGLPLPGPSIRAVSPTRLPPNRDSDNTPSPISPGPPSAPVPDFVREIMQFSKMVTSEIEVYVLLRMTNGSVLEAKNFLQTGFRRPDLPPCQSPPLWTLDADTQLASHDPDVLRRVIDRFGVNEVCRRIAFLSET
ncbi:unnamed protein product [Echinostoma caproni]|uniref:Telomeric repeat-binding factor 2-interacting protein 1 n=1 Tax=Echinostoma caproni TaxID=27848 RepID=A0A183ARW9_9TREM|nr:unnamed protein product [Echinostoma caproni]